jgi:hypothetical protein
MLVKTGIKHGGRIDKAAIEKLTDQSLLANITMNDSDCSVRRAAVKKLTTQDVLAEVAINDCVRKVRLVAAEHLTCQDALARVAINATDWDVRMIAVNKLTDRNLLAGIAINDPHWKVRVAAYKLLGDEQSMWSLIAINADNWREHLKAAGHLTDQDLLAGVAERAKSLAVKEVVIRKFNEENKRLIPGIVEAVLQDEHWKSDAEATRDFIRFAYKISRQEQKQMLQEYLRKVSEEYADLSTDWMTHQDYAETGNIHYNYADTGDSGAMYARSSCSSSTPPDAGRISSATQQAGESIMKRQGVFTKISVKVAIKNLLRTGKTAVAKFIHLKQRNKQEDPL